MAKKQGYQIGQGKACQDVKLNEVRDDGNGGKSRDVSKEAYDDRNPTVARR